MERTSLQVVAYKKIILQRLREGKGIMERIMAVTSLQWTGISSKVLPPQCQYSKVRLYIHLDTKKDKMVTENE